MSIVGASEEDGWEDQSVDGRVLHGNGLLWATPKARAVRKIEARVSVLGVCTGSNDQSSRLLRPCSGL